MDAVGRHRLVGVRNGARQPTTRRPRPQPGSRRRTPPRPAPHTTSRCPPRHVHPRYGRACSRGQVARPQLRMDFVKPDRLLPPPATFRRIVTAQRGIGAVLARSDYRRREWGRHLTRCGFRSTATELGCVRWRGPVGAPVVVAVHGITANAWSFGTVAQHLKGEAGWSPSTSAGAARVNDAPEPYRHPVACRRRRRRDRPPRRRAGGGRRTFDGRPRRADVRRAPSRRGRPAGARRRRPAARRRPDEFRRRESLDELLGPAIARIAQGLARSRHIPRDVERPSRLRRGPDAGDGALRPLRSRRRATAGSAATSARRRCATDGRELLTDAEVRGLFDRHAERGHGGPRRDRHPWPSRRRSSTNGFVVEYPQHDWRFVPGSNHYSVLFGECRRGRDRRRDRRRAQLPRCDHHRAAPAAERHANQLCARGARSPSISAASRIVLAGYIATTTATTESSPSRVETR